MLRTRLVALAAFAGLCAPAVATAAGSMLIWPVNPTIQPDRAAGAIWLENRGGETAVIQIRLFAWGQGPDGDAYRPDEAIVASPPMATIAAGARQLVRLTDTRAARPAGEQAYRVVVDEVPTGAASDGAAVRFQMRYSLPLFVHGDAPAGAAEKPRPSLSCAVMRGAGGDAVRIVNSGGSHARLSNARIGDGRTATELGSGLLGYALGGGMATHPVPAGLPRDAVLSVQVNGGDRATLRCA